MNLAFKRELFDSLHRRQYSRYPPHYREPICESVKLEELFQSGEAQQHAFMPIKAARNDNNTSIFYDEITRYFYHQLFNQSFKTIKYFCLSSKFINTLMKKGDKITARNLVEQVSLVYISTALMENSLFFFPRHLLK